jgi:hypothetical protein
MLNDAMVDLDKEVIVKYQGSTIFEGTLSRSMVTMYNTLDGKGDPNLTFSSILMIKNNEQVSVLN